MDHEDGFASPAPDHGAVNADGTLAIAAPDLTGLPPAVARVATALARLGVPGRVHALPDDDGTTYGGLAARLGVEAGAVVRAVVVDADGEPILVLASGDRRPDLATVGALVGAAHVRPAGTALVRAATGQAVDAIAPVGHPRPLRTVVDVDLSRYAVVWAHAGHPGHVVATNYDELLRVTAGEAAEVGEEPA